MTGQYVPSERAFTLWTKPEGKDKPEKIGEFRNRSDAESQAQRVLTLGKHKAVEVYSPKVRGEEVLSTHTADE